MQAGDAMQAGRVAQAHRVAQAGRVVGEAVRDAVAVVRSRDARVAGALAYWTFDAAVLWAMLRAFGAAPSPVVVALAYLIGQVANTLPLPGSVSGGITGVLIAFGVPAGPALAAVLAYRTVAVWLPTPAAIAALPALRSTVARWAREDGGRGRETDDMRLFLDQAPLTGVHPLEKHGPGHAGDRAAPHPGRPILIG
jgi:hypothetical protein